MKLIICKKCSSVISLALRRDKLCDCNESGGRYDDDVNATIWGPCFPLGFANRSLVSAIKHHVADDGMGNYVFEAFTIPLSAASISRVPDTEGDIYASPAKDNTLEYDPYLGRYVKKVKNDGRSS